MRFLALVLLVFACGCPRPTPLPPPPPAAPQVAVPAGCEGDLSGRWVHATDSSYRYRAEDDGGTLLLRAWRAFSADAGFVPRRFLKVDGGIVVASRDAGVTVPEFDDSDGGNVAARIVLARTPGGFVGETTAEVMLPSGRSCSARYPTRVLACGDGGLLIRSRSALAVGDSCQPPANPQPTPDLEHRLVRPGARFH